jgi:hypothetical protein
MEDVWVCAYFALVEKMLCTKPFFIGDTGPDACALAPFTTAH